MIIVITKGIPIDRPIIRGKFVEVLSEVVVGVTPFVITLEDVTVKPPIEAPPLSAEESDEVAAVAAGAAAVEVELPPVGSAFPATSTELFLIVLIVIKSTLSSPNPIAFNKAIMSRSIFNSTAAGSSVPKVKPNYTFTLFWHCQFFLVKPSTQEVQ